MDNGKIVAPWQKSSLMPLISSIDAFITDRMEPFAIRCYQQGSSVSILLGRRVSTVNPTISTKFAPANLHGSQESLVDGNKDRQGGTSVMTDGASCTWRCLVSASQPLPDVSCSRRAREPGPLQLCVRTFIVDFPLWVGILALHWSFKVKLYTESRQRT